MNNLPQDLSKFGIRYDPKVLPTLKTRRVRKRARRVTKEEVIYLGNTFSTSHKHADHESLLPAFSNMVLMKN